MVNLKCRTIVSNNKKKNSDYSWLKDTRLVRFQVRVAFVQSRRKYLKLWGFYIYPRNKGGLFK